jgi:hypothetical protein
MLGDIQVRLGWSLHIQRTSSMQRMHLFLACVPPAADCCVAICMVCTPDVGTAAAAAAALQEKEMLQKDMMPSYFEDPQQVGKAGLDVGLLPSGKTATFKVLPWSAAITTP